MTKSFLLEEIDKMQKRKDIVVCGLGNPLLSDEGIGICLIQELMAKFNHSNHVDFIEIGTSQMNVVHAIAERKKAILIDCAMMGEPPGSIKKFAPDDVTSIKNLAHFSLHEGDLLSALELSRNLGECPENVIIFGIQPESIDPGEGLSPTLSERMSNYIEVISSELKVSPLYNK